MAVAFAPFNFTIIPAGTTVAGTVSILIEPKAAMGLTFYIEGTGTISGGTLILEEAASHDYTGTWSDLTNGTPVDLTDVTGGEVLAYHVGGPGGQFAYGAVRARVGDAVTGGGSITVKLVGA